LEVARVHDLGDVPLPEAMDNEACLRDIEASSWKAWPGST
jgi:hypothetical protein